ncbi:queuosine precursor transporter [Sediminibacillus dalangtanensis]|uniref:Probable queuosine precursor transporter n=1 Tax=Sediminibacillus dalangtanensis TaxID=2729421 RepID=A0ABX7VRQ0_9BACI|nr:queuosine precursor transporter [Sediminibacillus dalangtanensis]QTM99607.1 queuosine precursor transporter [Sediminibacillus dalangtanensis]
MENELLWILFALINFVMLLVVYRIFGKPGLFVWIGMSTVVANIQVVKTIELFGLTATLGNIIYGTAFLATDILNEKYGKQDAKKAVWLGFFTLIAMTIMMQVALLFKPGVDDIAQGAMETLFGLAPKIAAGSLAAYIISQYFDVWIYAQLKRIFPGSKYLWLRNNGSTMVSQLLDSAVFCGIAFFGEYPLGVWMEIFFTTYIIKFLVAAIDTPFLYWAKHMHNERPTEEAV